MAKSRVAKAKAAQGYAGQPLAKRCRTCKKLSIREEKTDWGYVKEFLSCSIGDFKVTANATCNLFELGT